MNSLKTTINLDNNYYMKILDNNNDLPLDVINVENINIINIIKKRYFLLKIDFDCLNKNLYKKILKRLLFIKRIILKNRIEIGVSENSKKLLGYIINYDKNNIEQNNFILGINSIFYDNRYQRYNNIYDTVCKYLDNHFYGKNLCDFKDSKCGEKRNTTSTIGCCHHYRNKLLGPLISHNLTPCKYLTENYTCGAQCISCKLFTCDYLEKKGIKFKIKDILLLDTFFNPIQKYFIKYMVFTPKEKILKRLMIL